MFAATEDQIHHGTPADVARQRLEADGFTVISDAEPYTKSEAVAELLDTRSELASVSEQLDDALAGLQLKAKEAATWRALWRGLDSDHARLAAQVKRLFAAANEMVAQRDRWKAKHRAMKAKSREQAKRIAELEALVGGGQ